MSELLYIPELIVLIAIVFMSAKFQALSIKTPNVLQVMFWTHVLAQFIPSLILAHEVNTESSRTFVTNAAIASLMIPIGGQLANLFGTNKNKNSIYTMPLDNSHHQQIASKKFHILLLSFCGIVFVTYVLRAPFIPLLELFSDSADFVVHNLERREASSLGLIYGISLRFFMPLLFILSVVSYSYYRSISLKYLILIGVMMSLLYNAWPGSKTPVAMLFILVFFTQLIRKNSPSISNRKKRQKRNGSPSIKFVKKYLLLLVILGFVLGYPLLIYMVKPVGQLGFAHVFEQVVLRIFLKPAENNFAAYELFSYTAFTQFADIRFIAEFLGLSPISLSKEIAVFRGFGDFTNSPPTAIGTFYAQGGDTVVYLGFLFASFIYKFAENLIRGNASITPFVISIYSILMFAAFRFSWANFHTLLFTEIFGPMLLVSIVWYFLRPSKMRVYAYSN